MRFKQHINEKIVFKDNEISPAVFMMLKKVCLPYLQDAKKAGGNMLFRGVSRPNGDLFIRKPRQDRRPNDSSQWWHDTLDGEMKAMFGVYARSEGVFCKLDTPTGYGYADYMPIPAGKYSCIYSTKIDDAFFYEPFMDSTGHVNQADVDGVVKTYKKGNLIQCARDLPSKGYEIALICDKYYALRQPFYSHIQKWMKESI